MTMLNIKNAKRQGGKTADWLSKMTQWTLLNSNAPARVLICFGFFDKNMADVHEASCVNTQRCWISLILQITYDRFYEEGCPVYWSLTFAY